MENKCTIDKIQNLYPSPINERDWQFSKIIRASDNLPSKCSVDYPKELKVLNQGKYGFCWAFVGAAIKTIQEYHETGRVMEFSPLAIAKETKKYDGLKQEGSTYIDLFKTLYGYGSIKEHFYPYDLYNGNLVFPEIKDEDKITKYKIKNYAKLRTLDDLKQAINLNKPVALGLLVGNNFKSLRNNSGKFIKLPFGESLSGHAILALEYDDNLEWNGYKGFIKILNSWDKTWGDNGFAWIPYDYITYKSKDIGFSFFIDMFTSVDLENDPVNETVLEMYVGNTKAKYNGKEINLVTEPIIYNNRTMVAIRDIGELFGFEVLWDGNKRKVTFIKEEKK